MIMRLTRFGSRGWMAWARGYVSLRGDLEGQWSRKGRGKECRERWLLLVGGRRARR